MNQPLESHLETLRQRLRFLPEPEREKELAELRSHLEERIAAYESAGDSPEQAADAALEKWGDCRRYVLSLRLRWLRNHPKLGLMFGLILGMPLLMLENMFGVLTVGMLLGSGLLVGVALGRWYPQLLTTVVIGLVPAIGFSMIKSLYALAGAGTQVAQVWFGLIGYMLIGCLGLGLSLGAAWKRGKHETEVA